MKFIKLYENYTADQYKAAMLKIKKMISDGATTDKINTFINSYVSDDMYAVKEIYNSFERICKCYNNAQSLIFADDDIDGIMTKDTYGSHYKYHMWVYLIPQSNIDAFIGPFEYNRLIIEKCLSDVKNIDVKVLNKLFWQLFKIIEWVNINAPIMEKYRNENRHLRNEELSGVIIEKLHELNTFPFIDPFKKYREVCKSIRKTLKTLLGK